MAKYRCKVPECGHQVFSKPPLGYRCPNCRAVDTHVLVRQKKKSNNNESLNTKNKKGSS